MSLRTEIISTAKELRDGVRGLEFGGAISHVYHPLDYAWGAHELYLKKYGSRKKRVIFMGMNPGPWGMAQTGVPFGEVSFVRDWLKINVPVSKPREEHAKRPIEGFSCEKSEVSGRRLWGFFAERFGEAEEFFQEHFVLNYCPLVFMEESGKNKTPDKLPASETEELMELCDRHLKRVCELLEPEWLVGVGGYAEGRAKDVAQKEGLKSLKLGKVLHPSPASPAANRGWAEAALKQLLAQKIWCE